MSERLPADAESVKLGCGGGCVVPPPDPPPHPVLNPEAITLSAAKQANDFRISIGRLEIHWVSEHKVRFFLSL
jgi:hypothetical protein